MKDFLLDESGDVVIKGNDIRYTADSATLLAQKLRMVLSTNKGEWKFDTEEGINYRLILVKNPDYDQIISTIQDGIHQVDETLRLKSYNFKRDGRKLTIDLVISTQTNEEIQVTL